MASTALQLTINGLSAKLEQVNGIFSKKINCYVVVSLSDTHTSKSKKISTVDNTGNNNPKWNSKFEFLLADVDAAKPYSLLFKIFSRRKFLSDKLLGQVTVPMSELLSNDNQERSNQSHNVTSSSGKHKGVLYLSYKFVFVENKKPELPKPQLTPVKASSTNIVEPANTTKKKDDDNNNGDDLLLATAVLAGVQAQSAAAADDDGNNNEGHVTHHHHKHHHQPQAAAAAVPVPVPDTNQEGHITRHHHHHQPSTTTTIPSHTPSHSHSTPSHTPSYSHDTPSYSDHTPSYSSHSSSHHTPSYDTSSSFSSASYGGGHSHHH